VVDEIGPPHRSPQRLGVEDVAADGLGPQLTERARRLVGPGEGPDRTTVGDQVLDDRRAENAGAPRDEGCQLEPSDKADPKRTRYSTAESTVITAAASMAHSSSSSGPIGSS
jgi:hypothetical protein